MTETINHFSLVSRLFGNLFYRSPTDAVLSGVFAWLQQEQLSAIWPLESDAQSQQALATLQMKIELGALAKEYEKLFGQSGAVSPLLSDYGVDLAEFVAFRDARAIPSVENIDHVGLLLLTASWLEDHIDSPLAQQTLFEDFLLPVMATFLTKVEQAASLPFYRALAVLTRELLAAMADELENDENFS